MPAMPGPSALAALALPVLLLCTAPVLAQGREPASVAGRVVDAGTGLPLTVVTVRVLGTDRSALTRCAAWANIK